MNPFNPSRAVTTRHRRPGRAAVAAVCLVVVALAVAACGGGSSTSKPPPTTPPPTTAARRPGPPGWAYVFTYFTGDGKAGIRLAVSRDGLGFRPVYGGRPVLSAPQLGLGLHRDPSLLRTPAGRWYLAWTSGARRAVALASSGDLRHWSTPRAVEVMSEEPTAINSWAPELLEDPGGGYALIFSSTVRRLRPSGNSEDGIDNKPLNHRLYVTRSDDLRRWSPSRLFWDRDLNVLDGTIVPTGSADPARRYALVYKDERLTPLRKNLRITFGPQFDGPWAEPDQAIKEVGVIAEGPSLARSPGGKSWYLYADRYAEGLYAMASSPDLRTWTSRTEDIQIPDGARHGTVLRVPAAAVVDLLADTDLLPEAEGE